MVRKLIHSARNQGFTINIEGGIGNQLFQYVAGLSLASHKECSLTINNSRVIGNRHGGACITDFVMPTLCRVESTSNRPRLDNRVTRAIRVKISPLLTDYKFYFSPEVGFDENLMKIPRGTTLNGYFQTFRYLELLSSNGVLLQDLRLKNSTPLFRSLLAQADKSLPVVVHFRRGDYVPLAQEFGILSSSYYGRALEQLQLRGDRRNVWIYSDDFEIAKKELGFLEGIAPLRFMEETKSLSALEVLMLMSIGSAHIIANSSFSWWSASLSKSTREIVAPSPWFKKRSSPKDLIPSHWLLQESSWV